MVAISRSSKNIESDLCGFEQRHGEHLEEVIQKLKI